mmetsp:Transcript_29315/g.66033  ORF Transcript_29315/g.66033 Transcript_29315/m.66033 type:complete len:212 (+) Transcript_29315:51-686(+)
MALRARLRRLAVIKDSFPNMRTPGSDPSRPSVSRVMKEMLQNQTAAIPTAGQGREGSLGTPSKHVTETDGKSMPTHLPRTYLPRASGSSAPSGPSAAAAFRGLGRGQSSSSMAAPPLGQKWRPPGWQEAAQSPPVKEDKGPNAEFYERPMVEVWGVRVVAVLVLAVLYIEFKDVHFSPSGQITRKARPTRQLTPQEEEEQRRLHEGQAKGS